MIIRLITVGKLKEQYWKEALSEYQKRLTPFCSFSVTEIQSEQIIDESLIDKYKEHEADRILQCLKPESYKITLEICGKKLTSPLFAQKLKNLTNSGISDISFIIGGANGLSQKISSISDFQLSFSDMTFTHQMARIILAEQIYRAFKINSNEPYHR